MKKILFSTAVLLLLIACETAPIVYSTINYQEPKIADTIEHIKIVKNVRESVETGTSYSYKMDWLNGKLRHQPRVTSQTVYYIVYTDGTIEQTTKENGMFYEKGDTIKTYTYTYTYK